MRSTNGRKPTKNKLPLKRATGAEKEERIAQTMRLVIIGNSTADVKQWFRDTLEIQWCQALRYLRLARARLAAETGLSDEFTLDDMKRQHYTMAMRIAREDSGEEAKDRLAALKHAGAIYGVVAPKKIAPTTPDGTQPYEANKVAETALRGLSVEELRILKKVKERMTAIAEGEKSPDAN